MRSFIHRHKEPLAGLVMLIFLVLAYVAGWSI